MGKNKVIYLWCLLIPAFLTFSCRGNEEGWKGTITDEDGVEVIRNPVEPMIEGEILTLEEDLSITGGGEESSREMILDITALAVDGSGRILVLDPKAVDIKFFDEDGNFVKTIGRKGGGPGEFLRPEALACSPSGEIVVLDGGRRILHVFDGDGIPIREIPVGQSFLFGPEFFPSGGMVMGHVEMGEEVRVKLYLTDDGANPVREYVDLFSFHMPKMPLFLYRFGVNLLWHTAPGDFIVHGDLNDMDYRLAFLDTEGRTVRRINKAYEKIPLSSDESKALILEWFGQELQTTMFQIESPDYYPPFQTFLVDEEGRIYVKRFESLAHKDRHLIEIFGTDGKYLGDVTVPAAVVPMVIRNGLIYAIAEDEEGYKSVKRFRMSWNPEVGRM